MQTANNSPPSALTIPQRMAMHAIDILGEDSGLTFNELTAILDGTEPTAQQALDVLIHRGVVATLSQKGETSFVYKGPPTVM